MRRHFGNKVSSCPGKCHAAADKLELSDAFNRFLGPQLDHGPCGDY